MKENLIWGWVFVGLALIMIVCIVYGCFTGNWTGVSICTFALIPDVCNAISCFKAYCAHKRFVSAFKTPRGFITD